jgi:hypothetical protein
VAPAAPGVVLVDSWSVLFFIVLYPSDDVGPGGDCLGADAVHGAVDLCLHVGHALAGNMSLGVTRGSRPG